jgi:very-short-patch-repair endonuclease
MNFMKIIRPHSHKNPTSSDPLLTGEGLAEYHRGGEIRCVPDGLKIFSRSLRKEQTPHEAILWSHLKSRRFNNLKFRRQHPIGPYIVDFCCLEKWLVIELDGGQHNKDENIKKDEERDCALSSIGYTMLRIWNNELTENIDGVFETISNLCGLS